MRIERGKSGVVVYLRPDPGERKLRRQQVSAPGATPLSLRIGEQGELIFTRRAYHKLGSHNLEYDQIVKVFAPAGWLYYEYVALQCDTCRKVPETCGAGFGGDNGCFRYEPVDEEEGDDDF